MAIRITPDHKYFNDSGQQYQGVTSLLGMYKNPFDALKVATSYAKKHGQTPEYWVKLWDNGRDSACDTGHEFHDFKEQQLLGRGIDVMRGAVRMVRNQNMYRSMKTLYDLPDGLYAELMLWDDGYQLAGTADKTLIETVGNYRYVDLDDYKTNKKIDTSSYISRSGQRKMMLPPINHMMDCNFVHYELQLSLYMFVLERQGFTPRSMRFTHYPPNPDITDVTKRDKPVIYPLHYRKREVIAILNHFTKQQRNART